ncbi:MAG TPA: hypothetical protein PK230_04600 [Chitinophagales bacterium]|nr:hypothetical protein [Chitinophagales bacterium]
MKSNLFGRSPCGSGFTGLRYRYGASTSLTAALTIPNALRHSNNSPYLLLYGGG